MPVKSIFEGKAAMTYVACHRMDFDVVNIDVIIVLVLLMVIESIIRVRNPDHVTPIAHVTCHSRDPNST